MPQHKLGTYYRPIPCEGIDITWCNRPLLCRLGIHRPFKVLNTIPSPFKVLNTIPIATLALTDNSENADKKGCLRCPYFWIMHGVTN